MVEELVCEVCGCEYTIDEEVLDYKPYLSLVCSEGCRMILQKKGE